MLDRLQARLIDILLRNIDRMIGMLTSYRSRLSHMEMGAVEEHREHKDETMDKIRMLIRLRWAMDALVPTVLLALAWMGVRMTGRRVFEANIEYLISLWPNWTVAVVGLGVNGAYNLLLRKRANLRPIALAQVWLDIIIFSLMIYTTGGIRSPFTFLYTVPVLAASLLLSFRSSLAAAATSTFLLGLMAALQFHRLLPGETYFAPLAGLTDSGSYVTAMVTINGILYFLIAFSSGAMTSTIHKQEASLKKRANESTMLYEVSSVLQQPAKLDSVLNQIMDILVRRLDIDRALMYLVNDAGDGLDLKVLSFHPRLKNPPREGLKVHFPLKREAGLTAICAIEKTAFNVTDPLNHPHINRELAKKVGLNPFALAPMISRGNVIGVIGIDRSFRGEIITFEEAQILAVTASQAGLTIQNAEIYEQRAG